MDTSKIYKISKCISGEYDDAIYQRIKKLIPTLESKIGMDFDYYSDEKIADYIIYLLKILDSDQAVIGDTKKKEKQYNPNKKMLDSIYKGDLDLPLMDLIKDIMKDAYNKSSFYSKAFLPNFYIDDQSCIKEKTSYINELRMHIRFANNKHDAVKDCMDNVSDYIVRGVNTIRTKKNNGNMYNPIEALYFIRMAQDAFCDVFMQGLLYGIIDSSKIKDEDKHKRLDNIEHRVKEECCGLKNTREMRRINLLWDMALRLFVIEMKNELNTYKDVFEVLDQQMSAADYVYDIPNQYHCKGRYLDDFKSEEEYRVIILERELEEKERNKPGRFKQDVAKCQELCNDLYFITGRQLYKEYLQHIKVVYREVLQDKIVFNGKQTRTILNNLLKKTNPSFDSVKESAFLREKISRGLMREKGYGRYYSIKNRIQNMIYQYTIEIFETETYDEIAIAQCMKMAYKKFKIILLQEMEGL